MAADRGAFIDQSQSFNAFMATPTKAKVTSMHFYSWKKGLKTGNYFFSHVTLVSRGLLNMALVFEIFEFFFPL